MSRTDEAVLADLPGHEGNPHQAKHKRGEQSSLHQAFPKDVQEFEIH